MSLESPSMSQLLIHPTTSQVAFRLFEVPIDLGVTGAMALLFWGTFSGMMTAIVGGLVFSLLFRVAVKL